MLVKNYEHIIFTEMIERKEEIIVLHRFQDEINIDI